MNFRKRIFVYNEWYMFARIFICRKERGNVDKSVLNYIYSDSFFIFPIVNHL